MTLFTIITKLNVKDNDLNGRTYYQSIYTEGLILL